jgi:hypothetical protein
VTEDIREWTEGLVTVAQKAEDAARTREEAVAS